jgi:hypothetical protein
MQLKFRDGFGLLLIFLSTPFELCLRTFGKFATGKRGQYKIATKLRAVLQKHLPLKNTFLVIQ